MNTPKLNLYNTLTRTKEPFTPQNDKAVSLYVCGITPYDHAHIGHARAYVVFDVLFRTLRHIYGENAVKYVRNFTDIDDKILARAAENGNAENWQTLAQTFIDSFHQDMQALNVLPPTAEPRVTTSIPAIITLIEKLVAKGIAYPASDGIYYDTSKVPTHDATRCWCGLERAYNYGRLSGKDKNTERVARVEASDGKRNASDFALWKFAKPEEPASAQWPSPWGKGRPGWHIECSAMAAEALGETIDIHGGGEDLQFPHHENEIAQSEGATGGAKPFVNYWMHNSFITVGGTKMSKSLGNFTTIKDALQKYSPEAIRLWLLQTHYRKPVDYSDEALQAAENAIRRFRTAFEIAYQLGGNIIFPSEARNFVLPIRQEEVEISLANDLATSDALAHLFETLDALEEFMSRYLKDKSDLNLKIVLNVVDMLVPNMKLLGLEKLVETKNLSQEQLALFDKRFEARKNKSWTESDRLRDELKAQGILLDDRPDGITTWRRI